MVLSHLAFFLSHGWGEEFEKTIACLEQFLKDFRKNNAHSGGACEPEGVACSCPVWGGEIDDMACRA